MANLKLTVGTFANAKNLQSTTVNPIAAPVATPREGGFTLRNRVNFSSVNSSAAVTIGTIASAAATATNFQILQVPKRTILHQLVFTGVPGSTAVAHAFSYTTAVSSAGASTGNTAKFEIGAAAYNEASQKAASVKVDIDEFAASIAITKKTGVIGSTFGKAVGSLPLSMAVNHTTSAQFERITFPFGGFVTMNIKAGSSAVKSYSASDAITGGALTGVMEAQAYCTYLPE